MVGSAGALGGLAVGSAFVGSSAADEHEEDAEEDEETDEAPDEAESEFEDDVDVLNYALTLEYLEARFYQEGLDNIGEEALCNCKALSEDSALGERVYDELRTIQEHEEIHVETLRTVIQDLGGEPIEEPEFDFGLAVEYPMAFLGTAAQLEDIGVSAYAGAAPHIENEELVPPALSIHSVEARHASFLQTVMNESGFPDAFDEPRSRSEVEGLAAQFIVGMDEEDEDMDEDDDADEADDGDDVDDDETNGDDASENGNGDDAGENGNGDDAGENGNGDDAGENGNGDDAGENGNGDDAGPSNGGNSTGEAGDN